MAAKYLALQKRTIVILGKQGAGKATIANEILGERRFSVSTTVDGMTRSPNPVKREEKQDTENRCLYEIYVVDVDITSPKSEVRDSLQDCNCINLILFVYKNGQFTNEEKQLFETILADMPKVSEIAAMVITNCENLSEDATKTLVKDFKTNECTSSIAARMEKGIYTVGFPNLETVNPAVKEVYSGINMENDRDKLNKLILNECGFVLSREEILDFKATSKQGFKSQILQCKYL